MDGSPAIEAGNQFRTRLPGKDLAGNPRNYQWQISAGRHRRNGSLGIHSRQASAEEAFGAQTVGSTTSKTVTLTNAQDRVIRSRPTQPQRAIQ